MCPAGQGSGPQLLVGRSRERNLTRSLLSSALSGQGALVILSGEAGIGKTTLAEDICREASTLGALVLVGHCYDRTESPPYGPWTEVISRFRALSDLIPELRAIAEPNLAHSSSQSALFSEMREFLVAIARERPLVILLDDLHWADSASLDLLRFIARQLATVSILLQITYRSDEVTRQHPLYRLLPVLVREALAVRIDLSPLSDDDVCTLIEHNYQLPVDDASRLAIHLQAHAEGNPLFLGELLRSLEGTVLVRSAAENWKLGSLEQVLVPVLLRQVIDTRLARLGREADNLLAMAAVIGPVVPIALWATVSATSEAALLPLIERAIDARIFDASADGLGVRFAHALIREALYESILPPRRRAWHREIGETLTVQYKAPDPDTVAYHFSQAGDQRAVVWLTRAGEGAQRVFAWRTATERFEAALSLLAGDDTALNERGWLLFRLALLRRFVNPALGSTQLADAERLGVATSDAALVACARFFQGMLRRMAGNYHQGTVMTEEAVALIDALSLDDRNRLATIATTSDPLDAQNGRGDLTLTLAETGRFAEAQQLGIQIVSLPAEQTAGSRGDAYYGLGYAYAALGHPEAARRAFSAAREIFRNDDHRSMVLATLFDELVFAIFPYQSDRPNERKRAEAELSESFTAMDDIFDQRSARTAGVVSFVLEGNWTEVFAIVEQSSLQFIRLMSITLIAPLARHCGNTALAWSLVREGLPAGPDTAPDDAAGYIVPLRALAVTLSLDAGDYDAARQWLTSLDRWLDWSGGVLGQADAHLGWAAYYQAMGDNALAQEWAQQAVAAASSPRQPLALLAAHRLLGEIDIAAGQYADAETQLRTALALADACGARHEQALTFLALARLCHARGDVPAAREHLNTVRARCTPMDAALTLAQADALDARLLSTPTSRPKTLPAGLTPREGEVLRLLATGLPNSEIAAQLFLSIRTVNAHLTTIYAKLGVTSRGAAIRFALDHDLR